MSGIMFTEDQAAEILRIRTAHRNALVLYLEEKLAEHQYYWHPIDVVGGGGFGVVLRRVPEKFWQRVIRPEFQRMAEKWGCKLSTYKAVPYRRHVDFKKDWGESDG